MLLARDFTLTMDQPTLCAQIKQLIISELDLRSKTPADIADDALLFGGGLGLDSLDALQLVTALEERYGVTLPAGDEVRPIFASVSSIAEFIEKSTPA